METSHSVLDLPELLSVIFSGLDKKTQAQCAVVCKAWSSIALVCLWSTMDNVIPLLHLLGTFKQTKELLEAKNKRVYCLTYLGSPSQEQWVRFNSYAERVKTLTVNSRLPPTMRHITSDTTVHLSQGLLVQLAIRRRTPFLVPNLTHLIIDASIDIALLSHSVIFFGHLLYLDVAFDFLAANTRYVRTFFEDLAALSPTVRELTVRRHLSDEPSPDGDAYLLPSIMSGIHAALRNSLGHLMSLSRLTLPATLASAEVIASISCLPSLYSIVLTRKAAGENGFTYVPQFDENRFDSLREVTLPVTVNAHAELLANAGVFGKLTSISIHCAENVQHVTMEDFINGLLKTCSNIRSIALLAKEGYRISIAPLFAIPSLRKLLVWPFCASPMNDIDLKTALSHHDSSLEILHLPWLCGSNESCLSLGALQVLAKRCPKLRSLSICVDLDQVPAAPDVFVRPDEAFKCLERLIFGSSKITDFKIAAITVFLFKLLCPAGPLPRIEATDGVPDAFEWIHEESEVCADFYSFADRWLEVRRTLQALKEDAEAKTAQICRLEKELREAWARIARLEIGEDRKVECRDSSSSSI